MGWTLLYVLQLKDYHLHSTRAHLVSFFISVIVFFPFGSFFFFFFITSVSLLRFSAFSFISREFVIDCGSIFQDSCFYSLDDLGEMRSSDIWVILEVVLVSKLGLSWFLAWQVVWGILNRFSVGLCLFWCIFVLHPGHSILSSVSVRVH